VSFVNEFVTVSSVLRVRIIRNWTGDGRDVRFRKFPFRLTFTSTSVVAIIGCPLLFMFKGWWRVMVTPTQSSDLSQTIGICMTIVISKSLVITNTPKN
jgi:hypothetical protein